MKSMIAIAAVCCLSFSLMACANTNTVSEIVKEESTSVSTDSAPDEENTLEGSVSEHTGTVQFGSYPQEASGSEESPIEWVVLREEDGYTLLLSKYLIDSRGWMNQETAGTTWADSDLRLWLNTEFLDAAFTEEEQERLAVMHITQPVNSKYDTDAGEESDDKVTLLSFEEVNTYFPEAADRHVKPTDYAIAQGCYTNAEGNAAWWTRSPGMAQDEPEYLSSGGEFGTRSHKADEIIIGVRPVIMIKNLNESASGESTSASIRNTSTDQPYSVRQFYSNAGFSCTVHVLSSDKGIYLLIRDIFPKNCRAI